MPLGGHHWDGRHRRRQRPGDTRVRQRALRRCSFLQKALAPLRRDGAGPDVDSGHDALRATPECGLRSGRRETAAAPPPAEPGDQAAPYLPGVLANLLMCGIIEQLGEPRSGPGQVAAHRSSVHTEVVGDRTLRNGVQRPYLGRENLTVETVELPNQTNHPGTGG